jgi:hypothetical protein
MGTCGLGIVFRDACAVTVCVSEKLDKESVAPCCTEVGFVNRHLSGFRINQYLA